MRKIALLCYLFVGFGASSAFANNIDLFGGNWAPASSWSSANNQLTGGWEVLNLAIGPAYGSTISQGDFQLSGYEGGGHYASGFFSSIALVSTTFVTQGTLSNIYVNPTTDLLSATFTGDVGFFSAYAPITGTLYIHLNPNGTLGQTYISTNDFQSLNETPEPNTMALLGTGLVGILGAVRRKLSR